MCAEAGTMTQMISSKCLLGDKLQLGIREIRDASSKRFRGVSFLWLLFLQMLVWLGISKLFSVANVSENTKKVQTNPSCSRPDPTDHHPSKFVMCPPSKEFSPAIPENREFKKKKKFCFFSVKDAALWTSFDIFAKTG